MEVTTADAMDMTCAAYHACHLFVRLCLCMCVSEASCKERHSRHTKRSHTRTQPHANGAVVPHRAPKHRESYANKHMPAATTNNHTCANPNTPSNV